MPKFKSRAAEAVFAFTQDRMVEPGEVLEVPGEVVEEVEDAYIVEHNGEKRAWPKANWKLAVEPKPEPPTPKGTSRKA